MSEDLDPKMRPKAAGEPKKNPKAGIQGQTGPDTDSDSGTDRAINKLAQRAQKQERGG